jgi:hypothetical protein
MEQNEFLNDMCKLLAIMIHDQETKEEGVEENVCI